MKIEINNLTKEYDELIALNGVNITLVTGMYGLLGANGAGKSTLMKILAGILDKTSGGIKLDGNVIKKTGQIRKLIGYIPQTFSFYPNMTVFEIMDYFSALNGVKENRKERIGKLLDPKIEYEFFQRIREASKNKTIIYISHRLSNITFSDKIIVMEKGKVIESGNMDQLMFNKGKFYELYNYQKSFLK